MVMKKVGNLVNDGITDTLEKVASPASRAGSTIERVGKMLASGVSPRTIATQMTDNSPNGNSYSESDVRAYEKIYEDAKTKAVITAKQTRALMQDQQEQSLSDNLAVQN